MNKLFKRISAVALSAVMALSLSAVAFADTTTEATNTANDRGTVTIEGLNAYGNDGDNLTVKLYPVAVAQYSTTDPYEFVQYNAVYGDILAVSRTGEMTITEEVLNAVKAEIDTNGATTVAGYEEYYTATLNGDKTTATAEVPVGSYLVVVEGSESTTYALMIVSAGYELDEDGLVVNNGTISDVTVKGDSAWLKSSTPTIDKEVKTDTMEDFDKGGDAEVGTTVAYEIFVDNIPHYAGEYPVFYVTDVLDDGLTMTDEELAAIKVTVNGVELTAGIDYIVNTQGNGFVVNFVVDGVYTLNEYEGETIEIDFEADVTANMALDSIANNNDAILTYSTNSSVEGSVTDIDDEVHVYTFDLLARKAGYTGDELDGYLNGAGFTLYHSDENGNIDYSNPFGSEVITSNDMFGEDGYMYWAELEEGTYYLVETTAPDGYVLNETVYKVVIDAEYDAFGYIEDFEITVTYEANGQAVQAGYVKGTVTGTGKDATVSYAGSVSDCEDGTVVLIGDEHVGELPSMGGTGTTIFMIAGAFVIACAVAGIVVYRRRTAA